MFGKASLFLVLGFSLIFLILGQNFGRVSNQAVDNYVNYYSQTVAHDIAVSGANVAVNNIYRDQTWRTGIDDNSYQDGKMLVDVIDLDLVKKIIEVNSVGIYNGDTATVQVKLRPGKFSDFAYFSEDEDGIWWTDGDTVNGAFHTQDYFRVHGHPVFNGDVSTKLNMIKYGGEYTYTGWGWHRTAGTNTNDLPIIDGQYGEGVNIPIPPTSTSDLAGVAGQNGKTITGHDTVFITFVSDSIKYRYHYRDAATTVLASSFAPNGVIYANEAVVRVQGTVKGQYTLVSNSSSSYGEKGSIYIDNDITYSSDPRSNTNSTDMLGLVAKKNVYVTDNAPNRDNVIIQASVFAQTGGFGAENYDSGNERGYIYLLGGVTQHIRRPVGTFGGRFGSTGYLKSYTYDQRFTYSFPPYFPDTGAFKIVSWYEWNYLKRQQ